jgi:hypothetical protein
MLINELIARNPSASAEELTEGLLRFLAYEAIPQAINQFKLPPTPSPFQLKQEEFRKRRTRKTRHAKEKHELELKQQEERHRKMIRIIKLQSQLNGGQEDNTTVVSTFLFKDFYSPETILRRELQIEEGMPLSTKTFIEAHASPYTISEKVALPVIIFDTFIQNLMQSNPIFNIVVVNIENRIRSHEIWQPFEFRFSHRRDIELPDWEKTIITINVGDISFDEKMDLWNEIDKEIRQSIQEIQSQSPKDGEYLTNLNKTLFTSIEL